MGVSLEWTTLLPAWDSVQESSESGLIYFIPVQVIDLPSWFVKINRDNANVMVGAT